VVKNLLTSSASEFIDGKEPDRSVHGDIMIPPAGIGLPLFLRESKVKAVKPPEIIYKP